MPRLGCATYWPILGRCKSRQILEFEISHRALDVAEAILAGEPKIVGVGVYIWNAEQALRVVADLKRIRPGVIVILGGPEVSHETDQQEIVRLADYVITGEADLAFAELCQRLLTGTRPLLKILPADLPEFAAKKQQAQRARSNCHMIFTMPRTSPIA